MPEPEASVILNNYNYGRFLKDAIDSALGQTYAGTEVIVVDDGSTDDSKEVISSYGNRIVSVLKENEGQASAFNAGFAVSRGNVVIFLDADDMLFPTAVATSISLLKDTDTVKVHWPLCEIDENGERTGRLFPGKPLVEGNLRDIVIDKGPTTGPNAPTSGNAWPRTFLEQIFPVPEAADKHCADAYLFTLAPIFGLIKRVSEPLGYYRVHRQSYYSRKKAEDKLKLALGAYEGRCAVLRHFLERQGVHADVQNWKGPGSSYGWMQGMMAAAEDIKAVIDPGNAFILVDEDSLGVDYFPDRHAIPFLERNGYYYGPPDDDDHAICELDRLRKCGAGFIVFISSTFWWLDQYAGLNTYLRSTFKSALENEWLTIFDLRQCSGQSESRVKRKKGEL